MNAIVEHGVGSVRYEILGLVLIINAAHLLRPARCDRYPAPSTRTSRPSGETDSAG
jgi:hypothetical protein